MRLSDYACGRWPASLRGVRASVAVAMMSGAIALAASPGAAEIIRGQVSSTFKKDGSQHTVCLAVSGTPSDHAEVMAVACDPLAPVWSIEDWTADGTFRIAYGPYGPGTGLVAGYCLDVDTGHPYSYESTGIYFCAPSLDANTVWQWSAPPTSQHPMDAIVLKSNGKCLIPDVVGQELKAGPCGAAAPWKMLDEPPTGVVFGTIQHTRADGRTVCLGTDGPPVAGAKIIGKDCLEGDAWHLKHWAPSSPFGHIGHGRGEDLTDLCLSNTGNTVELLACEDVTNQNAMFQWNAANPAAVKPDGPIILLMRSQCIAAAKEGEHPLLAACETGGNDWTLGPITTIDPVDADIFRMSGTFIADLDTTYRVFAVGGGAGGGADEGGGGGSGFVAYFEVDLYAGQEVEVIVGTGGLGGRMSLTTNGSGAPGGATEFGEFVAAPGGDGGGFNNRDGGYGGSGGGADGADGGTGGSDGHSRGVVNGGKGQGPSAIADLCKILTFELTAGPGGTVPAKNGLGGGGGGGIVVGSETVAGQPNPAGTATGGTGFGGGGAGGDGTVRTGSQRNGGAGASGVVIVEHGGKPPHSCE
ncbi:MAG: hypothetical protein P1U88_08470 [Thalassobaculaceae bacterium]|nr:hypothetical protein [Thalassobaculaceae bacterium]